jgi:hypothetical protein
MGSVSELTTDEELAEKVGRALYVERPLELDQESGDDWDILPDEWREEWVDAGRVAVAAVKKARRLSRAPAGRAQSLAVAEPQPTCGVQATRSSEWGSEDRG